MKSQVIVKNAPVILQQHQVFRLRHLLHRARRLDRRPQERHRVEQILPQGRQGLGLALDEHHPADIGRVHQHAVPVVQRLAERIRILEIRPRARVIAGAEVVISDLVEEQRLLQENRNVFLRIEVVRNEGQFFLKIIDGLVVFPEIAVNLPDVMEDELLLSDFVESRGRGGNVLPQPGLEFDIDQASFLFFLPGHHPVPLEVFDRLEIMTERAIQRLRVAPFRLPVQLEQVVGDVSQGS